MYKREREMGKEATLLIAFAIYRGRVRESEEEGE